MAGCPVEYLCQFQVFLFEVLFLFFDYALWVGSTSPPVAGPGWAQVLGQQTHGVKLPLEVCLVGLVGYHFLVGREVVRKLTGNQVLRDALVFLLCVLDDLPITLSRDDVARLLVIGSDIISSSQYALL